MKRILTARPLLTLMVTLIALAGVLGACSAESPVVATGAEPAGSTGSAATEPTTEASTDPASEPTVEPAPESPAETDLEPTAEPTPVPEPAGDPDPDSEPTAEAQPAPAVDTASVAERFSLDELPDLVNMVDRAIGDSSIEPLGLAEQVAGFPLPIVTTENASLVQTSARMQTFDGEANWRYDLATFAGAPVGDVDIELDDNGAGAVELREFYDPIMAELGLERRASSASDPGDPGGPQLQTHNYAPVDRDAASAWNVNGVSGTLEAVRVTLDEDILGASYREELELLPGFRSEVQFSTAAGSAIPVPLLAALAETVPTPPESMLVGASVGGQTRGPDSFDAERGLNYIQVELEWEFAEGTDFDQVLEFYGDPAIFDSPELFTAGQAGFGENADRLVPADSYIFDGTDLRQETVLVQRYEGLLGVDAPDEDDPIRITYRANLNPNDLELEPEN